MVELWCHFVGENPEASYDFKIPGRNHLKGSESWSWNIAKFVQKYFNGKKKQKKLPTALQPEALGLALASWKESTRDVITVGKSDKTQTNSSK